MACGCITNAVPNWNCLLTLHSTLGNFLSFRVSPWRCSRYINVEHAKKKVKYAIYHPHTRQQTPTNGSSPSLNSEWEQRRGNEGVGGFVFFSLFETISLALWFFVEVVYLGGSPLRAPSLPFFLNKLLRLTRVKIDCPRTNTSLGCGMAISRFTIPRHA